jgi:ABC-type branched-subunit amino acid transport system ATPase component/ABC-type branched-subunit amino acid transport system permease subunit
VAVKVDALFDQPKWVKVVAGAVALVVAYAIAYVALPKHIPVGVAAQGIVLGALQGLIAMGLVLVYRSIRIINFSQATIGAMAAALAIVLVVGFHWNYWLAVVIGLAAAVATGFLVDALIQWRFTDSPRLIVMVVTIGVAYIVGVASIEMPHLTDHQLGPLSTFKSPFNFSFRLNPNVVTGDWIVVLVVVPLCLLGLYWFFIKTDIGVAIRGAADSPERAQLLGIPVRNLTRITWMVAAGLSGIGAILAEPITGAQVGATLNISEVLLVPLAAFVLAGQESLPLALMWSCVIGVIQWTVYWNYNTFVYAEVALFVLIVVGLLLQRQRQVRVTGGALGDYVAVREVAPIPNALRRIPEIQAGRVLLGVVAAALAVAVPLLFSTSIVNDGIYCAIYAILAVSMVILSGWAGQISLGQVTLAGMGAAVTGAFTVHAHMPFLLALLFAGLGGAALAALIGIPAMRLELSALPVITLAFAVVGSDWLFSSEFNPWLVQTKIDIPVILNRFDLGQLGTLYEFSLLILFVAIVIAANLRRSRTGRAILSVRDNSRAASAYGISPYKTKLLAFCVSGFIAGLAGALYIVLQGGLSAQAFSADQSLSVFIMVVIGGLGSMTGAIIGALYLEITGTVLSTNWQLLATGAGVLAVLIVIPEGFGGVVFKLRDYLVASIARRNGLTPLGLPLDPNRVSRGTGRTGGTPPPGAAGPDTLVPETSPGSSVAHTAALRLGALEDLEVAGTGSIGSAASAPDAEPPDGRPAVVTVSGIDASYGSSQVLFEVGMGVAQQEVVALLGTNGAGKTTVLRTISGMMRPKHGRVRFLGRDVTGMDPSERVHAGLVTVLGGRGIFQSLTVEENLRLAAWTARRKLNDQSFAKAATERVLALFPVLQARQHQRAGLLSGGEQQMLALGQALLCRPKLLMIDELSLGLAPNAVADLLEVIRSLAASGVTVVVVEQSVNVATAISNRAIFMERGRIRFSGPTPDLSQQPELLRSVFLHAADRARKRKAADLAHSAPPAYPTPRTDDVVAVLSGEPGFAPGTPATAAPAPVPAPVPHAFQVHALTKLYGGVSALRNVSLHVDYGEILGIIGSNGAGKTTLFDVCSGYVKPDAGTVWMDGRDITDLSPAQRASKGLGRVFQDARIWPTMTVHEALATALEQYLDVRDPIAGALALSSVVRAEEKMAVRVEELLDEMGLERFRDNFISELSTGTRRVLELACALANEPTVLLLDEPTSGIAQRESEALGELLLGLRAQTGAAFIVIEHDVPLVSSIADRMVCMHLGEVIADGDTTDVLTDPIVVEAYLGADAAAAHRSGPMPVYDTVADTVGPVSP